MKNYVINLIQPRAALGNDQSGHVAIYAMGFADRSTGAVYLDFEDWSKDVDLPGVYRTYVRIEIIHPIILWGSPEDIQSDFLKHARRILKEKGLVAENNCGDLLWV